MLEARAIVRELHAYRPPLAGRVGLRLDFNENTVGCSPRVLARLRSLDAELLARYPEREPVENEVATFLSLDPAQILLTNGVDEAIHLLPALPVAWPKGSVSGLCARGGFQVEIQWQSHRLVSAAISSNRSASCHVRYGKDVMPVRIEAGRKTRLTERSFLLKRT